MCDASFNRVALVMPHDDNKTTPAIQKLADEAVEIATMAADLRDRGLAAESVFFALAAAERLRAIEALRRMRDAG